MNKLAHNVDRHVGERIRKRRIELGLTQEHVAVALGISYQQVQKYETGANRVSAGRLYEIAHELDVDIHYFFDDLEPNHPIADLEHGGTRRSTIDLVRNYGQISEPGLRTAVSSLIRSLAENGPQKSVE
ncbi:helix-turn-helix domain-containing protein [Oceanibacterium hippocampi]|uniref:Transcriptional repressor DicA n=1 Tax=Oceanibacterium hippocampi TaxID=745714 RepID=A0A1Y5SEL0_9PROT|nr:helix-turn-helix transcriptional regulator [Oceanibacterium hippocampi]SLN37384.1 transcriptional repressor DicA [Oceanibacterium hippocampi]